MIPTETDPPSNEDDSIDPANLDLRAASGMLRAARHALGLPQDLKRWHVVEYLLAKQGFRCHLFEQQWVLTRDSGAAGDRLLELTRTEEEVRVP